MEVPQKLIGSQKNLFHHPPPPAPTEKPEWIKKSSNIFLKFDEYGDDIRRKTFQPVLDSLSEGNFKESIQAAFDERDMSYMTTPFMQICRTGPFI